MATDLAELAERLPSGLHVSVGTSADLERTVEFLNRHSPPGRWTSPVAARRAEELNPEPARLVLVVDDAAGAVAAYGSVSDGGAWASPDRSWRLNLRVVADWRRRGIGRTLLDRLETHARANGASRIVTAVRGNEPEGLRFGEALGYRAYHERIDAYLDPTAFDAGAFEDPDAAAARLGIRLASYEELEREQGDALETLQRALLALIWSTGRDVPMPLPQSEQPPFEQAKMMFFSPDVMDATTSIIALREGRPIGVSMTDVKENGVAYTHFTGVSRDERGKGIALLLKLRAIRALKDRRVKLFGTTNDEANAAMRGVNRRLGYRPEPTTIMVEKRFT